MKQTCRIISTYAADVSGVASALYELGGLIVMHDASGCNSTYNTHDEPRWYDQPAMVYISALDEIHALTGDADEKLIRDVKEAAAALHPRFIALAGTPIPMMMGTDLPALARLIEQDTGIKSFGLNTNSMHSYQQGVSAAFLAYAKAFLPERAAAKQQGVNLLGCTPLDFSVNGSVAAMREFFAAAGLPVLACWAMDSTPEALAISGEACCNVVVAEDGLALAKWLQQRYGTPYVVGQPIGEALSARLLDCIRQSAADGRCRIAYQEDTPAKATDRPFYIVGEAVSSCSLAYAIAHDVAISGIEVICMLEEEPELLRSQDHLVEEEDAVEALFQNARAVVADPMFRPLIAATADTVFYSLPHEAFSGRIYRKDIPILQGGKKL